MNHRRNAPPDSRSLAEKAFKTLTTKPADLPVEKAAVVPGAKETVSLRIDRDVLVAAADRWHVMMGNLGPARVEPIVRNAFDALRDKRW
jgi:hypothetical protein